MLKPILNKSGNQNKLEGHQAVTNVHILDSTLHWLTSPVSTSVKHESCLMNEVVSGHCSTSFLSAVKLSARAPAAVVSLSGLAAICNRLVVCQYVSECLNNHSHQLLQ